MGEKNIFPLNETTYVSTWKSDSLFAAFLKIKNEVFKQDYNHEAVYYKELDLLHVQNGKHSAVAGSVLGGQVEAEVMSISDMFSEVETDGTHWYCFNHIQNNKIVGIVPDYRIAVLYELAKRKYKILKENKMKR